MMNLQIKSTLNEHAHSFHKIQEELSEILLNNGIIPHRMRVLAGITDRKNRDYPSGPDIKRKIGKVVIYIEKNLTSELSLQQLADEIELSKYQLIRGFRKEEGKTPWKYLVEKRIEKVQELLEEGMPPAHAAVEAGFYDQSHMNKVFREQTGQTPKEYQEENFRNKN